MRHLPQPVPAAPPLGICSVYGIQRSEGSLNLATNSFYLSTRAEAMTMRYDQAGVVGASETPDLVTRLEQMTQHEIMPQCR